MVQIFLRSQRRWAAPPLAEADALRFRAAQARTGLRLVFAHGSYLVNLAAPDAADWRRAVQACTDELERAERLGLPWLVIHPGSHRGAGTAAGVRRLVRALDELHRRTPGYRVRLVLENTAGGGHLLGARAAELAAVLASVREPERLAVCLDTCHLFAAGYDIRTPAGFRTTLDEFDHAVGLGRVVAWHVNDARAPLGSGLDRHEHIGRGHIGLAAFRFLLREPRVGDRPMVLETPKDEEADRANLALLRALRRGRAAPRGRSGCGR